MLLNQGDQSDHPQAELADSETAQRPVSRPKPVLANATYLLDNTRMLMDHEAVEIDPNHIPTDYSSLAELDEATKLANNLQLDMNMYMEERLQDALDHNPVFLEDAKKIVKLIHDKMEFASLGPISGSDALAVDLREKQIKHITERLKDSYPEGTLQEIAETKDRSVWKEDNFKSFLDSFKGNKEGREKQAADADMKVLKQLKTQLPYFGGSIEYQQQAMEQQPQERSLEYYIYHISTLTRDSRQQYGCDTDQGKLLPKDMKPYDTNFDGEVPFNNLRNLGTGVVESPFEKLPSVLREQIRDAIEELDAPQNDQSDDDRQRTDKLKNLLGELRAKGRIGPERPSEAKLWDECNEDEKKHLFGDILRLPWSEAHLHGGSSYEQVTRTPDLKPARSTSHIRRTLPPREEAGLMNVVGVNANVLEKPEIAGETYAKDPRFQKLEQLHREGKLADIFPGAVPPKEKTLQQEFVDKHTEWHERAMKNAKPQIGGISGHTLGYMNLYAEALEKVPESERKDYPTQERLRAIMLAGLIGTKRHHSYDEVMSASTGLRKGTILVPGYDAPDSYGDVLNSKDEEISKCARAALEKAREDYPHERDTVLKTITGSLKHSLSDEGRAETTFLKNAVGDYLKGLGTAQKSTELSDAIKTVLAGRVERETPEVGQAQQRGRSTLR